MSDDSASDDPNWKEEHREALEEAVNHICKAIGYIGYADHLLGENLTGREARPMRCVLKVWSDVLVKTIDYLNMAKL